jgi:hypothetical protein
MDTLLDMDLKEFFSLLKLNSTLCKAISPQIERLRAETFAKTASSNAAPGLLCDYLLSFLLFMSMIQAVKCFCSRSHRNDHSSTSYVVEYAFSSSFYVLRFVQRVKSNASLEIGWLVVRI